MEAAPIGRSTATRYLAALGISLLFNPSSPTFAFTPDLHSAYALKAAQAYQSCTGVKLPAQLGEALAEGTDAEDSSLLTLYQRISNWHFYNRNQTLVSFWFADRNLDDIFSTRVKRLHELLVKPDADPVQVYEQAGRVLHYIQDMSVPGHVLPAYHAKLPGSPADPFDEFEGVEALPAFSLSEARCGELLAKVESVHTYPAALLDEAARNTLKAIEQIDKHGKPIVDGAWQHYWVYPAPDPDEARKGWGDYGNCPFAKGVAPEGCKSESELVALFERQSLQTLENSVLMLIYLQKRLAERDEKAPAQ